MTESEGAAIRRAWEDVQKQDDYDAYCLANGIPNALPR